MKIAFILSDAVAVPSNGVVEQAKMWRQGLIDLGHDVCLVNMWESYAWADFDAIVYFHYSIYMAEHIKDICKINPNIYVAPILDPAYSVGRLKIYARWGISRLKLTNHFHSFFSLRSKIKGILARSEFERDYLIRGFGFESNKCHIVPLSFNIADKYLQREVEKEDFCLHMSLLADDRKNVRRLIEAAIKFDFRLVLAGKLRNEQEQALLNQWIGGHKNIEYVGYVVEERKYDLFSRARVFALPSLIEGVGIVGLEASMMGCDVVMTSIGGPKEYYDGLAEIVDPYDVDQIGCAVKSFLEGETFQPDLREHIKNNYSIAGCMKQLERVLSLK